MRMYKLGVAALTIAHLGGFGYGVLFLASPETSYITGHVLNINGGMYMA